MAKPPADEEVSVAVPAMIGFVGIGVGASVGQTPVEQALDCSKEGHCVRLSDASSAAVNACPGDNCLRSRRFVPPPHVRLQRPHAPQSDSLQGVGCTNAT